MARLGAIATSSIREFQTRNIVLFLNDFTLTLSVTSAILNYDWITKIVSKDASIGRKVVQQEQAVRRVESSVSSKRSARNSSSRALF